MPTAVMTLSSEKTMSSTAISAITTQKLACPLLAECSSCSPLTLEWISSVDLPMRKSPPKISTKSRPVIVKSNTLNSGLVSFIIQNNESSSAILVSIASESPKMRPLSRCSGGSLPTRIAINMMLSIPSTISSPVSVTSDSHASGEKIQSNIFFLFYKLGRDYSQNGFKFD